MEVRNHPTHKTNKWVVFLASLVKAMLVTALAIGVLLVISVLFSLNPDVFMPISVTLVALASLTLLFYLNTKT